MRGQAAAKRETDSVSPAPGVDAGEPGSRKSGWTDSPPRESPGKARQGGSWLGPARHGTAGQAK